ncbi:MAG: APC family permease [Tissierellia bacterium]|nr:APC family permease [Tissierellia bacterium]
MTEYKATKKTGFRLRKRKRGSMTKRDFFMLGFGSMVGVGWAVSSNHWLGQAGGPWNAFIGFLIGTLLLIPIGLSYGELMSSVPVGGGVMVYTYRAFGTGISFISSWFVALAYLTILPWEAIYINEILSNLIPFLSSGFILYHINGEPIYLTSVILGIVFAVGLFWINYRGSKFAAKLQSLLSWVIIIVGILVIIFSSAKGHFSNLYPLYQNIGVGVHQNMGTGIMSMVVLVPFFMAGFDTIPQSIEEAHPKLKYKNIAKVLVLSILLAGIFYALIILSTASVTPWRDYALREAPAMSGLLLETYGGGLGRTLYMIVMVGTLAGLFSTWNGMFMASARLLQSMGRSGFLPSFFATEHALYATPVGGSLFCFVAAVAGPFMGLPLIDSLTSLGSVAFVLGWFLTCLSAIALRKKEPDLKRPFKVPGGLTTLTLSVLISSGIVLLTFIPGQPAFMGKTSFNMFIGWLILGGIFYYFTNFGDRGISEEERKQKLFGPVQNRKDSM